MYKGNKLDQNPEPHTAMNSNDSEILRQLLLSLGNAIDAKDRGTRHHSGEVARVAEAIGWAMGLSNHDVRWLHMAGLLHDVGKIGIPDSVLTKPGPLDDKEWKLIFSHPEKGDAIVRPVGEFSKPGSVADMVLHHHERFDGSGYPKGLKGDEIPLGARIISVADTLSTMMQDRPYRKGRSFEEASKEVLRCSGTAYDPQVVETFMAVLDDIRHIMENGAE